MQWFLNFAWFGIYLTMLDRVSVYLVFSFLLLISSCKEKQANSVSDKTSDTTAKSVSNFVKVSADQSMLYFNNSITHDLATKFNLFDYDYFYNGSGVAVIDVNNDGLQDLFFTGNLVDNKLYLNKGDLVFEDISEAANINTGKQWASGVTVADVNMDGWMDIYVSQGGPHDKEKRKNLLFINQQDMTFAESSEAVGLADEGISTQSAFFDLDKDGDLDCVVMNENDYYGLDPDRFYRLLSDKTLLMNNSSHLYRNDNGNFVNITEQAGLLKPTFGLGLCVSDINEDGWLDIYIANDYYVPDAMYINNGDGTFTDKIKASTNQVSFYGMGLDIADLNNDNLKDIFVLDMASSDHIRSKTLMASMNVPRFELLIKDLDLQYQYMFNSVQLNMGNSMFTNIAQMTGMSKTDWSWAALVMDTDHDSKEDVYVTNGYRRYALDNDSRMDVAQAKQQYRGNVPLSVKEQLYNDLPSEKLPNILYRNEGDLHFKDVTDLSELNEPSFSNGAVYADLDNDGDLDLVVNNLDQEAFLFKNTTVENAGGNFIKIITEGKTSEDFAMVTAVFNGTAKSKESKRVRGYLSAVEKTVHFGLGETSIIDSLVVNWPSGKSQVMLDVEANQTLTFKEGDAGQNDILAASEDPWFTKIDLIQARHEENSFNDFEKEVLLPYKQSTQGPSLTRADLNGDGLEDIWIGGAYGQAAQLFLQLANGYVKKDVPAFDGDVAFEDMESVVLDLNSDGTNDLYVVSGGSEFNERASQLQDRIYLNDGQANFTRASSDVLGSYTISGKTVTAIDFDQDGDLDLIVGNRIVPQKYPLHEPSIIYENDNGSLKNVTGQVAPDFEDFGMVNKVITTDIDNDGWEDFIAVGEWTHIGIFKNNQGVFEDISSQSDLDLQNGWWFNITETDFNNDGLMDYFAGNIGKNIKFKVSQQKPLRVYADDFDDNGTHDVVLSYKYNDIFVPARGKECSTQQMPFISEKMPTFAEFANASLEDIYGEKIVTAYQREANQFNSVLLINKGNGEFEMVELPSLVQSMPVQDAASFDIDQDGLEDLVLVGNIYNTEVETPRLDNPYGLVLLSNGKDGYSVAGPNVTGFYVQGNAKAVDVITRNGQAYILVGCNDGPVEAFRVEQKALDVK